MAVEIAAGGIRRLLRHGWLSSHGLLAVAALGFAVSLGLSFQKLQQQHAVEIQDVGMNFWLASQADFELQRLRHALDAYALGHSEYDRSTLLQRFEIFWSRLPLLVEGSDSALVQESGATKIVPGLIATLERMEPDLRALEPLDSAPHRRLAAQLEQISEPLHRMVVDVESLLGVRSQQQRLRQRKLELELAGYLLGILASGGLLIGLLVRESQRARALVAEATTARARIEHLAHHDPLTDLPNRLLFADRLDQALRRADRMSELVALHLLDVDHFKTVNDQYGHATGDRLLIALTKHIGACLRQSDTLARLGGDEFAIVQCGLSQPSAAPHLAQRIVTTLHEAIVLDPLPIQIRLSIGISVYPAHATTPEALQSLADKALYRAKRQGRARFCMCSPSELAPRVAAPTR